MYYKIENKESEVYKKLHELRTNEFKIERDNLKSIEEKTGGDYKNTFGHHGQQNFFRVTRLEGFQFSKPEEICLKTWKEHKDNKGIFVPNRRTKEGKEMSEFLLNLPKSSYIKITDILKIENERSFSFPFLEIKKDVLIIFLSGFSDPKDKNVIEITKKEFEEIRGIK